MMNKPMPDEPQGDDQPDEMPSDVTEEYIAQVKDSLDATVPEDFRSADVSLPVDAEDGERVAMLITGMAEGGKLTDAYAAKIDLNQDSQPEDKSSGGKLGKLFKGDNANEEA